MGTMSGGYHFLLIGKKAETQWPLVLQRALSPLGKLRVISREEAVQVMSRRRYDVIIVDAGVVEDTEVVQLVLRLRAQQPEARIVVASASPTWRRAREVLQAGATDYIRKSLDEEELRSKIQQVLKVPPSGDH